MCPKFSGKSWIALPLLPHSRVGSRVASASRQSSLFWTRWCLEAVLALTETQLILFMAVCRVLFWICHQNSVDNRNVSAVAEQPIHSIKAFSTCHAPHQRGLWVHIRSGWDTARTADQRDVPHHDISVKKAGGRRRKEVNLELLSCQVTVIYDETLLSGIWQNACCPWEGENEFLVLLPLCVHGFYSAC